MADIISRNQMSAANLKATQGANLDFVENPKTGKLFFSCGSVVGYISPKVAEAAANGSLTVDQMQYAECSTDNGSTWVPCLMMRGTTNVKYSF